MCIRDRVEEALYHHPAVQENAVVGVPDKLRGQACLLYTSDNLRSFSLYGIWTAGSGAYTNVTARVGNFSTDLDVYKRQHYS